MDDSKTRFSHERKMGGLVSELRIEPRRDEAPPLMVMSLSISGVFFEDLEGEFLSWVADSANNPTWISWVSQQWQPVDTGTSFSASSV